MNISKYVNDVLRASAISKEKAEHARSKEKARLDRKRNAKPISKRYRTIVKPLFFDNPDHIARAQCKAINVRDSDHVIYFNMMDWIESITK